ncbi:hypothetical protein [Petropleomorpha daqingensis]|uniref:Uncharacterized protein n=1 Tax=Petropleomorpha daqingensis TaxID=2026353 RepID=A0A853CFN3_9ACTN|nr:hypothetical protein [Petropleomorpha daqingensis]NYJ05819.1 hypothetical protein [Petropleomorpha daqingensis]
MVLVIVAAWLVASVVASALFSVLGRGAVQEDIACGYVVQGS